ncbi:MAG: N-acetyltransferase [Acidimicrobiia bacterium]|nr:N-acetyltransferase [Acidimicrobiia bacterium]
MTDIDVIEQPERNRFVVEIDGHEGEVTYVIDGSTLTIEHTSVPDELGGKGIAGKLVEAAVTKASTDGLTVVPRCPYAHRWLQRHPDAAATVTIDWPPEPT